MSRASAASWRQRFPDRYHAGQRAYREAHHSAIKEKAKAYAKDHANDHNGWRRKDTFDNNVNITFVSFDGEGSHGRYLLLACSASSRVAQAKNGLGTEDCLNYFRDLIIEGAIKPTDALIGFGLSYDFENILRDVSDEDYIALRKGQRVIFGQYTLSYISRKFLDVAFRHDGSLYAVRLQDIYPYFQQSFIKACASRNIELPAIVYEGKRNRSTFNWKNIEAIKEYNAAELVAMVKLAETLRADFVAAFQKLQITPSIGKASWYGPGSQAGSVLNASDTKQLIVRDTPFVVGAMQAFSDSYRATIATQKKRTGEIPFDARMAIQSIVTHPFTTAYFGGRIEAAMQGRFDGPLYDYDLTSAYPYAITRLPKISERELIRVRRFEPSNPIGVYLVRWSYPSGGSYYPFPYRTRSGNVYFPRTGLGWVLSPEVSAVGVSDYDIVDGYVIAGTEGYGSGTKAGDSDLATIVAEMGRLRAEAKLNDDPAHRGLKLLMNSVYGKTLQKEGSRRYFNAFVAAWITSVTRSMIYRLIGPTKPGEVISVMTDCVLSTVPLQVELSDTLGGWTLTQYTAGYQYAPGVYELRRTDGSALLHYRGFLRFDPHKAAEALDSGKLYTSSNPVFVSRTMAMHNKDVSNKRYQFVPLPRKEAFSLASKRDMDSPRIIGDARYFPPKEELGTNIALSWPYEAFTRNVLEKLLQEDEDASV